MVKKIVKQLIPPVLRTPIQKLRGKSIFHQYYLDNKCIFIHIPKAAGQSVSMSLFGDKHPGHYSARDFEWENSTKFNDYYKFTFVRNPWDRVLSAYTYLQESTPYLNDQAFRNKYLLKYPTFKDFIRKGLKDENVSNWVHFRSQTSFLKSTNNKIEIDFIGRLEDLNTDFSIVCKKLNKDYELNKTNTSRREDYKSYYDQDMVDIVRSHYAEDVINFGYDF